jgi:hypothetical protein
VNVGACGFAVALPYFFQNSMFAIFVLYFDLSQDRHSYLRKNYYKKVSGTE